MPKHKKVTNVLKEPIPHPFLVALPLEHDFITSLDEVTFQKDEKFIMVTKDLEEGDSD